MKDIAEDLNYNNILVEYDSHARTYGTTNYLREKLMRSQHLAEELIKENTFLMRTENKFKTSIFYKLYKIFN